jgi:epoxide hydrolase 4
MEDTYNHAMIKTNGVNLHVVQVGPENGPLAILLHGFPEYWRGWKNQLDPLAEAGYWVIAPDQRGYNLSDKPKGVNAYQVSTLAADVVGLIDVLGREKAYLVGHDWGAAVAWEVAIRYPQRLEKLAILNVPHPDVMQKFLLSNMHQVRKSWYIFFFQIPGLPEWTMSRNNYANMRRMMKGSGKVKIIGKGKHDSAGIGRIECN